MFKNNKTIHCTLLISSLLLLTACGNENTADKDLKYTEGTASFEVPKEPEPQSTEKATTETSKAPEKAEEITWDKLIPADYNPNEAIGKYIEQLDKLQDGDKEAMEIYGKIQAELDNAPVNMSLDGKNIKMPGFIAPLENQNGVIDEFLLVPYFGACIHSPPPPMNQTVMVKAEKGTGVKSEESSLPVWITGKLVAVEERTTIGAAGYRIENPVIEPYEEEENY